MYRIPLSHTPIDGHALESVLSRYAEKSPQEIVTDFEREISLTTGARYVVAFNSGTSAIHLALKALHVERGDVVIAPSFTYVASVNPILYEGAVPLLVDCESDTWGMDPSLVEEAIKKSTKKPKAIIVVHNYGFPANLDALKFLSEKYGIPILEDAAEALGSTYQSTPLGTCGEVGALSFNNNKIITTYGGGAVITNNPAIHAKVSLWASQSRENKPYYEHRETGYNYKMGPLNAAAGLALWPGLKNAVEKRREDFLYYQRNLESAGAVFLEEKSGFYSNRWFTSVELPESCSPAMAKDALEKEGIETRFLWKPMHRQPLFRDYSALINGVSDRLFKRGICLPSGQVSRDQQGEIVGLLKALF